MKNRCLVCVAALLAIFAIVAVRLLSTYVAFVGVAASLVLQNQPGIEDSKLAPALSVE